jgi:CBS domain-containing protein
MTELMEIITGNKSPVVTIKSDEKVSAAVKIMAEKNIGALLVMDKDKLVGILSERDMVRKLLASGKSPKDTPVSAIMTAHPYCADPGKSVEACIAIMSEHRFRHLPVLDKNNKLLGMVSMGDLVRELIADQEFKIEQFERYVTSGSY